MTTTVTYILRILFPTVNIKFDKTFTSEAEALNIKRQIESQLIDTEGNKLGDILLLKRHKYTHSKTRYHLNLGGLSILEASMIMQC